MREAVAYLAGVPAEEVELDVILVLPPSFTQAQQRAERLRIEAARLQPEAAQASQQAARARVCKANQTMGAAVT